MNMGELDKATTQLTDSFALICERQPAMRPILEAKARELGEWVGNLFQPFIDLGDGKITMEEFTAIQDQRAAEEQARRRAHYGEPEDGVLFPQCEHCLATHAWVLADRDGEYPPTYFECVDLDGEPCDEALEDDEDDDEDG